MPFALKPAPALQLDWLALVDGRDHLAPGLLLVRPLAFLILLGVMPGALGAALVADCWLAAWILGAATLLDLPQPCGRSGAGPDPGPWRWSPSPIRRS